MCQTHLQSGLLSEVSRGSCGEYSFAYETRKCFTNLSDSSFYSPRRADFPKSSLARETYCNRDRNSPEVFGKWRIAAPVVFAYDEIESGSPPTLWFVQIWCCKFAFLFCKNSYSVNLRNNKSVLFSSMSWGSQATTTKTGWRCIF